MIDDEKLIELIKSAEMLLEGLPKGFWRLIKLASFGIWQTPEEAKYEYAYVVGIMGNRCIFFDEVNHGFVIAHYDTHGEIGDDLLDLRGQPLQDLIEGIVNSRFVID